jgi:hypothetical protein
MTLPTRAALTWLVLFVVMFANGTVRVMLLQPKLGEDLARQVASLVGAGLVLLVSWRFARAVPGATARQLLAVGFGWLLATLAFEFSFGRFVSRQSWDVLLADYDIRAGRLWTLILVAILFGPWLATLPGRR